MKKYIFLALVTVVIFSLCFLVSAQDKETTEIPEGFVFYHYQYAYMDISLFYPENWINYSSQERGVMIYLPDSNGTLMFRATPLFGKEYTLAELYSVNMDTLKEAGAVFLESVPDKLSGYPAQRTLYTMKFGKDTLKFIRYDSIIGDLFYSFSFNTQEAEFGKYLNDIIKIVRSIKINQ
ncbi:MAG: hypothetical protein COZ07_08635 [Candidatus Infernicultor aquiphilus]|uniref:PsbP C-terminal domain-containing protein n=1 Tax=Candidatus Infernicultor aquiphilus TaxID=1805029 RepID=A0A1J5GG91_9BACT|nr:MAG: hypothetical protein AUK42_06830 [Candidatus Atribacteria bacterium CG2_30_33_13]PIW11826.1 MAG: hypothetical protein COW35_04835 [Candidatus Atribacteria bacterium CG17_big_fil_post_rev_8_21_14_2_50_34_11]PIX35282.1 MAG: hypothetical protein COZ58_00585 [Candidatus Atribacteria bacterium CG_4_8_14_3_um_filter_34_18]PIY31620.1 MAG: hypothetical protein COZ07_08635 [Candidatus Atribacteria bacterium CG_4_10_14_3_um_filter_34_13]PJB57784.1 MAG: hypothetical protein CO097_01375 [Candidatus